MYLKSGGVEGHIMDIRPVGGGTVSGTYTMPAITNCGLLTPLLSYLTAVPGNTMTANLTPAS